jgi:leucyl-tRNA---protein transferase
MSVILPPARPYQKFYRSGPSPCPYLPDRMERKLFTRLIDSSAQEVNDTLSRVGFRRSHDIVYRPACDDCSACIPVRVPTAQFAPRRSQRRILQRNRDLRTQLYPAVASIEQYQTFVRYQDRRHKDGDMSRMSLADFCAMIDERQVQSILLELRDSAGVFRGAMLADRLRDGFSAVYSFFDPDEPQRGLGTLLILQLIMAARSEGLPYAYLGYWIEGSMKMAYKAQFQPLEFLSEAGWTAFSSAQGNGA